VACTTSRQRFLPLASYVAMGSEILAESVEPFACVRGEIDRLLPSIRSFMNQLFFDPRCSRLKVVSMGLRV
jgi:hypothetical protein